MIAFIDRHREAYGVEPKIAIELVVVVAEEHPLAPVAALGDVMGRVSLQMRGRALISLKVNDANAMSASFDPCLPDPRGVWPVSPDRAFR